MQPQTSSAVCFGASLIKLNQTNENHPEHPVSKRIVTSCLARVNQAVTVALSDWSSGRSITVGAFKDILKAVKVHHKSQSSEQSI